MSTWLEYLGDGVYVEFERGMVKLTTDRDGRTETIYLEAPVWGALKRYVARHEARGAAKALPPETPAETGRRLRDEQDELIQMELDRDRC